MTELRLLHLTYAGMGRETARVDFDPRLTIVYGASDTGKSFVTESIDYMLGARKLNLIPEAEGYSQILLGIALPDASVITLMRAPQSGRVSVFEDDIRDLVYRSPDLVLSAQHSPRTTKNLSRYLMERIGLDGSLLATNDSGGTKLAGFRDLLHLCLISETRMVSKVSPVLRTSGTSGQTAHKSALKLLLTGAGEQPSPSRLNQAQRRVHKGKISLLDDLILGLQRQLASREANQSQLQQQLRRLLEHQETRAESLREVTRRHAQAASHRATLSVALARYAQRLAETDDLLGRFELLRAQYESDLARLGMVSEAGSLLGYFRNAARACSAAQSPAISNPVTTPWKPPPCTRPSPRKAPRPARSWPTCCSPSTTCALSASTWPKTRPCKPPWPSRRTPRSPASNARNSTPCRTRWPR
ncbi:hypothetical protein [Streptomyces canus]|uniref:hypothetical protein n=1 Tax=Streptomyces canus TaxID=58343 RepID=UPI003CFA915B